MVTRLGGQDLKAKTFKARRLSLIEERKKEDAALAATISKFISSLDGEYDDLAKSLPSDFMPKLLNRLIPFLKAQDSHTITTRRSTKRTVSVLEALKLSEKALSLDEFLSLLRLTDFKQDLLEMDIGRTIIEISETCVERGLDANAFLGAISTMKRSQANRLAKYLVRWQKRRKEKLVSLKVAKEKMRKLIKERKNCSCQE